MQSTSVRRRRPEAKASKGIPVSVGLTREIIFSTALEQIDKEGLGNFSLRNVAKVLGVNPTAIYWHVPGINSLLAGVVALVLRDLLPTKRKRSWQDWLRSFFHRFRESIRRHPNVAPLIGAQMVSNPSFDLDLIERILMELSHAGFSGLRLAGAYNAVIAAAVGFATQEFAPNPTVDVVIWQKTMQRRLRDVRAADYPNVAANLPCLANQAFILRWQNGVDMPLDHSFEAFVDIVIAGLEQMGQCV